MKSFEEQYFELLSDIRNNGHKKPGRNGWTNSLHGRSFVVDVQHYFPILTSRKIYWKGVAGEYAAFIRGANHVDDFKKWGCNFWDSWADEAGFLKIDYGNVWQDYNDTNQMEVALNQLKMGTKDSAFSRRIIIDAWRPDRLNDLSLPCCHYNYQFLAWRSGMNYYLDLIWTQRSADLMIGVPSDMITATIMLNQFASLSGMKPNKIFFNMGDTHIYEEHDYEAYKLITNIWNNKPRIHHPTYNFNQQKDLYSFIPGDIDLSYYKHYDPVRFELKV